MLDPTRSPAHSTGPAGSRSDDTREQLVLARARQAAVAAFAVLALTVLVLLTRSPGDAVVLLALLATIALGSGLLVNIVVSRRMGERRNTREAGQTRILQGMSRSGSPEAIVEAIIDELRRTADADHIVVARLRPVHRVVETTLVSMRAMVPPSRSILPAGVLDPSRRDGRTRRAGGAEPRTPQAVADDLARRLGETYALTNTLAAPLISVDQIVGALILSRRQEREWSDADRRLLAFSSQELSAALARGFAFEEAEIKANIDALTGLPNRGYLEELLSTIGPRRRSGDRLGALMIDLDHFKLLNDRYGHATGDRVLRAVAERIFDAVRADDTPARYGGEEFAVVLRRATPDQAVEVAERIRIHIYSIPLDELGIREPVTVSIGVAVADADDSEAVAVLAAADAALYRAKREGRNRVVLAR